MTSERWRLVEALYHSALETELSRRGAFLEEACRGDEELRSEVESLLSQQNSPGHYLERPVWELAALSSDSIEAGTKLGAYRIEGILGRGGMGVVYRARDSKLERQVAVKVLPRALAQNPAQTRENLARFEREAKVLASLNHPNIAAIYAVEESAEGKALVMELVEGTTLKGPLPLKESLLIAAQVADALEAAHDKGIIHRDLKPANIMITPSGVVKVLDFGLATVAKPFEVDADDPSNSPTSAMLATQSEMIMGTAAYMSPEQAAGKPVDKRTDIWSFGVVFFEMLTGGRLFHGETPQHTLAKVLNVAIDFDKLPRETPSAIRNLLRRCLDRDVKDRLRDIGEARVVISRVGEEPDRRATAPSDPWLRRSGWVAAGGLAMAVAGLAFALYRAARPADRPLVRMVVDLGPEVTLPPLAQSNISVVLSPDGTRILYPSGSLSRLYTRRLDQSKAMELPGTNGAFAPFFSPDGQWVGFAAHGKLNKIPVEGGPVVPLADIPTFFGGASWGVDGNIIASMPHTGGLVRIPASGGAPTTIVEAAPGEVSLLSPQILPGGKAVLYVAYKDPDLNTANVEVYSFADRRRKKLVAKGTSAHYLSSGHLIYMQEGTLFAVPFDVERLETRGPAAAILDDVAWVGQSGYANIDSARNGTLIYRFGGDPVGLGLSSIGWLDSAGKKESLGAKPGHYADPRLSPDGKRLALVVAEGGSQNVWVYDLQRDAMTRLTFDPGIYVDPIWSPDGQYLVSGLIGKGVYLMRADRADPPQLLYQSRNFQIPFSFAPDGKRLAYHEQFPSPTIWTLPLVRVAEGIKAGKAAQFLTTQSENYTPAFSPDGRWLAYVSNESGKNEVYVTAFPAPASGAGARWQISTSGGELPVWSRSRRELIYKEDDQLMAVGYRANGDSFVADKPRVWIAKLGGTQFDIAPDGKRVVTLTPVDTAESTKGEHEVVVLLNFFDELRRRTPLGK
jgi:serine/threonine-protein kinase